MWGHQGGPLGPGKGGAPTHRDPDSPDSFPGPLPGSSAFTAAASLSPLQARPGVLSPSLCSLTSAATRLWGRIRLPDQLMIRLLSRSRQPTLPLAYGGPDWSRQPRPPARAFHPLLCLVPSQPVSSGSPWPRGLCFSISTVLVMLRFCACDPEGNTGNLTKGQAGREIHPDGGV